jgi:hypothetical protein
LGDKSTDTTGELKSVGAQKDACAKQQIMGSLTRALQEELFPIIIRRPGSHLQFMQA